MGYNKIITKHEEYAGESFSRSISKKTRETWDLEDSGTYVLVGESGILYEDPLADPLVQLSGSFGTLVKSADSKKLSFTVPKSVTVGLNGTYKVIVDLTSTTNDSISDVIAEYDIKYILRTS